MKTFLLLPFIYFFCTSSNATAQNLVPNPGFEKLNEHPKKGDVTITCSNDWFTGFLMGTDYYNKSAGLWKGVPKNDLGYQEPHSGNAYAGICIGRKFIEYLEVKLTDTLAKEKKYLVEFYISRSENSKSSLKEFGILFSGAANKDLGTNGITREPDIKFISRTGYRDKKNWTKVSAIYEAKGFESYLILGHFIYNRPKYNKKNCHYYIDDVSITPLEKENDPDKRIETKKSRRIESKNSKTLIICESGHDNKAGDTTYICYGQLRVSQSTNSLNDTIKKYIHGDYSGITTLLIANPSQIINSIDFSRFTDLSTLILAGNDFDYIDSVRYEFFNNKNLKKIISSWVFIKNNPNGDHQDSGKSAAEYPRLKKYIRTMRPDIKIETTKPGRYNREGWGN